MTRVLFLHGSNAGPHGRKRQRLDGEPGFTVEGPALPFSSPGEIVRLAMNTAAGEWFRVPCAIAQSAADAFHPDVIVGSSMGGAVALAIESPAARVLIAPATTVNFFHPPGLPRRWRVPARTVILHSQSDELVPFGASVRLLAGAAASATAGAAAAIDAIRLKLQAAGYSPLHDRLVRIGCDHRCNDPAPQDAGKKHLHPLEAMIQAVRIAAEVAEPRA